MSDRKSAHNLEEITLNLKSALPGFFGHQLKNFRTRRFLNHYGPEAASLIIAYPPWTEAVQGKKKAKPDRINAISAIERFLYFVGLRAYCRLRPALCIVYLFVYTPQLFYSVDQLWCCI